MARAHAHLLRLDYALLFCACFLSFSVCCLLDLLGRLYASIRLSGFHFHFNAVFHDHDHVQLVQGREETIMSFFFIYSSRNPMKKTCPIQNYQFPYSTIYLVP